MIGDREVRSRKGAPGRGNSMYEGLESTACSRKCEGFTLTDGYCRRRERKR